MEYFQGIMHVENKCQRCFYYTKEMLYPIKKVLNLLKEAAQDTKGITEKREIKTDGCRFMALCLERIHGKDVVSH